ncbi:MAG: 2-oxoglutarate dehydrogenase E1 subunit family protein, partial [Micromonosporaceae bacterium]
MATQNNPKTNPDVLAEFGPNEWIVEDMYQRYLTDPATVDPAWHDFFADYRPSGADGRTDSPAAAAAPEAPAKPSGAAQAAAPAAQPAPAA